MLEDVLSFYLLSFAINSRIIVSSEKTERCFSLDTIYVVWGLI